MNDFDEIGRMTIKEFYLRLEAFQLRRLNEQQDLASLAWLNQAVQATTGSANHPRAKYTKFNQFFDRKGLERKIRRDFGDEYMLEDGKPKGTQTFAERLAEFERLKAKGLIDMNAWRKEGN